MTPAQQTILDFLKGATPAQAKTAPEIYTGCGVKSILIQPALDYLFEKGFVNRCQITKGTLTYLQYWPTGFKGPAMTKDPIPTFGKEPKVKPLEPASWAALKQSKSNNSEGIDMQEKPFKAAQIREILDATDKEGISHNELLFKLVGETSTDDLIRKAGDMITYTIKAGGYTKRALKSNEKGVIHTIRYFKNSLVNHTDDVVQMSKAKVAKVKKPNTLADEVAQFNAAAEEKPTIAPVKTMPFSPADELTALSFTAELEDINCVAGLSALTSQIGGDHYTKLGIYQPWEVFKRWMTPEELKGAMKKEVFSYLARERDKGGRMDIEKAMHTLQIYLELTA